VVGKEELVTHRQRVASAIQSAYGEKPSPTVQFVADSVFPGELVAAARKFVKKVEDGRAHSRETYAELKAALEFYEEVP
jgi:hypothetical protein